MAQPTMSTNDGNVITAMSLPFLTAQEVKHALLKQEADMWLHNPYGNNNVSGWFEQVGSVDRVESMEYTHREKTRATQSFSLSLGSAAPANAQATVTVESRSKYSYNNTLYGNTVTKNTMMPRVREVLVFPGGVEAIVDEVDVSEGTIKVTPTQLGENIPITLSTYKVTSLGIYDPESGGIPEPWAIRTAEFENQLSKIADAIKVTDLGESQRLLIKGSDGVPVAWTYKKETWNDKLIDVHNKLDARMLVGKKFTNTTVLNNYGTTLSGNGYFPYIDSFGKTIGYSTAATIADYDLVITHLSNIGAPSEYTVMGDIGQTLSFEDEMRDKAGAASFITFGGNKKKALDLEVNTLYRGGFTFHNKKFDIMNNPEVLGIEHKDKLTFMPTTGTMETGTGRSKYIKTKVLHGDVYRDGYLERVFTGVGKPFNLITKDTIMDITIVKGLQAIGQQVHVQLFKQ